MSTISRRAFLKTVGVGALSIAAVSVLAGCDTVPGNTEEVVTGVVEAKAGQPYPVAEKYVVNLTKPTYPNKWGEAFNAAIAGWDKDNTAEENAKIKADAILKADLVASAELIELSISVNNLSEENLVLTSKPSTESNVEKLKSNSSVITASCNGEAIPCAVETGVVVAGKTEAVTAKVAAPVNVKEIVVSVAIPGGKTLAYTIKNENSAGKSQYVDLSKY